MSNRTGVAVALALVAVIAVSSAACTQDEPPKPGATSGAAHATLGDEYAAALEHWYADWQAARAISPEKEAEVRAAHPARSFWPRFEQLANGGDVSGLLWMIDACEELGLGEVDLLARKRELVDRLIAGHAEWAASDIVEVVARQQPVLGDDWVRAQLRTLASIAKNKETAAAACCELAQRLDSPYASEAELQDARALLARVRGEYRDTRAAAALPTDYVIRRAGSGGKRTPDAAVREALIWLKRHQAPDGHWDCEGFSQQCEGEPCTGEGQSMHDVGVTGLALLCFLSAGQTHLDGFYQETVKNGLKYLISQQDENGCFGPRIAQSFMYDHACATLAMVEALGMTQARAVQAPAQRGIDFVLRAQNPGAAWRYSFPPNGDNDVSVTGWMIMALKSAKMADIAVDETAFASATKFIEQMTDPNMGKTGYTERAGQPSRPAELRDKFPSQMSESMTAAGMLVRIFAGPSAEDEAMIDKGADRLVQRLPAWERDGRIDFYYWYYGTLAMFQVGGPRWDKWSAALKTACIDHQRTDKNECAFGSWDALYPGTTELVDPWCSVGGRVYATAINCLSLEVCCRYPKVLGLRKSEKKKRALDKGGRRFAARQDARAAASQRRAW